MPPNRSFTVSLLEAAGPPFGAAELIGDFTTNGSGAAQNEFHLIVAEAFSSTPSYGKRDGIRTVEPCVPDIRELRLVLTVDDLDAAVAFYRDALGLEQLAVFENDGGRGFLLGAGRATLELFDEAQAAAIDATEVGRRVAGRVRVAFEVDDSDAAAARLVANGGRSEAAPVDTPWGDRNVRVVAPDGMQLTLFTVLRE